MNDGLRDQPDGTITTAEYRSTHFRFWFAPASAAEQSIEVIAARLERIRHALTEALDLSDTLDDPVPVYLSDVPDGTWRQSPFGNDASSAPVRRELRAVYLQEAPGEGLERSLVELFLATTPGAGQRPGALLVDGLLGHATLSADGLSPASLDAELVELQSAGRRISLAEVVGGPPAAEQALYRQIATSFVSFLLATRGPDRFKKFAKRFAADPDTANQAATTIYGVPLSGLESEWLASLQGPPVVALGMTGFLRLTLPFLRPHWKAELLILLGLIVTAAFGILLPLGFRYLIDRAILPRDYGQLWLIVGGLLALFVVQAMAGLGREYLSARVGASIANDLRLRMFDQLQLLSPDFYVRARVGDLMAHFSEDLQVVNAGLTQMLPMGLSLVLGLVASVAVLLALEWRLTLLMLLTVPIFLAGPVLFGKRAGRASYQRQEDAAAVATAVQENIGGQSVVRAYGLHDLALSRFQNRLDRLARSAVRSDFLGALMGMTAEISMSLVQVLSLAVGGWMVIRGDLSLGALVAFQGLLGNVVGPLSQLSMITQVMQQAAGGMQRIDELLDERPTVVDAPGATPLPRLSREIRLEDVSFAYTGEQVNLREVNLTIPAGQTIAVVGPSGSGKSTILNLLMRFYDPTSGTVTVDGHDLRCVTQASLRAQTSAVFQDTFLFDASVRENIRLGRLQATDAEVESAAKAAELHDLVLSLPRGYETVVGERGGRLSGGQRQRVALARAILRDPTLLVLDEPTSALDPETEAAITATLEKLATERTVVIVTHRLTSVVRADRIVVLERGRIIEQGTHDELIRRAGLYHRLWEQQTGTTTATAGSFEAEAGLRTVPLFQRLDQPLLTAIAERMTTNRYAAGEIIFAEGQPGDAFYVVVRGEVEVAAIGPTGAERRLAILPGGDYFGEMALLDDVPRAATVRARTDTLLLKLEREQFLDLLGRVPDLQDAFKRVVEERRRANRVALQG